MSRVWPRKAHVDKTRGSRATRSRIVLMAVHLGDIRHTDVKRLDDDSGGGDDGDGDNNDDGDDGIVLLIMTMILMIN